MEDVSDIGGRGFGNWEKKQTNPPTASIKRESKQQKKKRKISLKRDSREGFVFARKTKKKASQGKRN